MAWVRCCGGSSKPTTFTDTFSNPHAQTTTRVIGVSPKNGTVTISLKVTFATATSVSSASFNNNYLTVGAQTFSLWDYKTSPTSGSISFITFNVTCLISNGDSISINTYNPSSSIDRTWEVEAVIS